MTVHATLLFQLLTVSFELSIPDRVCLLDTVDRIRTSSATCLACHDGTAGPVVALHESHPVGVTYARARAEVALHPQGPINPLVLLPSGRVECVTCHSAEGARPFRTVPSYGDLCTDCHNL